MIQYGHMKLKIDTEKNKQKNKITNYHCDTSKSVKAKIKLHSKQHHRWSSRPIDLLIKHVVLSSVQP